MKILISLLVVFFATTLMLYKDSIIYHQKNRLKQYSENYDALLASYKVLDIKYKARDTEYVILEAESRAFKDIILKAAKQ